MLQKVIRLLCRISVCLPVIWANLRLARCCLLCHFSFPTVIYTTCHEEWWFSILSISTRRNVDNCIVSVVFDWPYRVTVIDKIAVITASNHAIWHLAPKLESWGKTETQQDHHLDSAQARDNSIVYFSGDVNHQFHLISPYLHHRHRQLDQYSSKPSFLPIAHVCIQRGPSRRKGPCRHLQQQSIELKIQTNIISI